MVKQMRDTFVNILGVSFLKTDMKNMVSRLSGHMEKKEKAFVVTANPEIVMHTLESQEYKAAIDQATYVIADGIGVVKGAQILGEVLPERVAGYDLMRNLLGTSSERPFNLYMLGAKAEVLEEAASRVKKEYPNINLVGSHHGFFDLDDESIRESIMEAKPDLILVALGLPRQEQWITRHMPYFDHGVFIGVGGSFDVIAGTVKRAPIIWQKLNIEWLYRLVKQPTRFKRMLALPYFAYKVVGQRLKGTSHNE